MAPAGSQQLRAQDPAPARRCGTEGRTERQVREGGNGDGDRDGGGDEIEEGLNDWGGRGCDDFVPGEVIKTAPSVDETT